MNEWQYQTHKCAVHNSLRYAYIALKARDCSTKPGVVTPYEDFYKRLSQFSFSSHTNKYNVKYSISKDDVTAFYGGDVSMEQFLLDIENCLYVYDSLKHEDVIVWQYLIFNKATLFSYIWELYSSTESVASVCSKVQSSWGHQLWEMFLILDTKGQLTLGTEDIVDLIERLFSSNSHSEEPSRIRSWFRDQSCVDFITFIQTIVENCLHVLQKSVQKVHNFVCRGIIHQRNLVKQSRRLKNWQLKLAVLSCFDLKFYGSLSENVLKGSMMINENSVVKELPASPHQNHLFSVCQGSTNVEYVFDARTESNRKEWIYQMQLAIKMNSFVDENILSRYRQAKATVPNPFVSDSEGLPDESYSNNESPTDTAWVQEKVIRTTPYNTLKLIVNQESGQKLVLKESQVPNSAPQDFTKQWKIQHDVSKSFSHPHVVSCFDVPEVHNLKLEGSLPSICMEYCDGGDLRQVLRLQVNRHGLEEPRIKQICADISSAIQYLHSKAILHRDVNPGNILIKHIDSEKVVYKLGGFHSVTRIDENSLVHVPLLSGSSLYTAPEVLQSEPCNEAADVWSLGVVVFECVTGKRPFFHGRERLFFTDMSYVIGNKQHGVIHVYRDTSDPEPYIYSSSLPSPHQLSKSFESQLTSWLQRALEYHPHLRGGTSCLKMLDEILTSKGHTQPDNPMHEENDSEKHLEAVKQAMNKKGKLDHTILQGVYLGPARSGKSSLIKRLTGEGPSSSSPSTGVADEPVHIQVRQSYSVPLSVQDSIWFKLTYNTEALHLMLRISHFISKHEVATARAPHPELNTSTETEAKIPNSDVQVEAHVIPPVEETEQLVQSYSQETSGSVSFPEGYKSPTEILMSAAGDKGLDEYLESSWSLYLTDTGGQMEFQDLLPLLVSGPSVFFITFRLNQDLDKVFTIQYELPDGNKSEPYESTLTLLEAILQSLASISSMGTFVYKGLQKQTIPIRPKVFLVGTHKDMLDPTTASDQIRSIDQHLQEVIKSTSHYCDGLIKFATPNQLIFTVNNLSEDETDFMEIRLAVEKLVQRGTFKMSSPSHWLIFGLVIRSLKERIVSFDECFSVAQQCGITEREELKEALHFLHTKLGVVRYFPDEELGDIVVKDPQVLFDKVTELIVRTFTFENVGKYSTDEFKKKGIFSLQDFERISGDSNPLLTPAHLVKLLQHLRIVAPFQIADGDIRYFIPCILAHAIKSESTSETPHLQVPPLVVTFKCGYCPKGLSGALITYLIANEMKSELSWKLQTGGIFRDQVTLLVGPDFDTFVIKILPTNIRVICLPSSVDSRDCSLEEICNEVRVSVVEGIVKVTADMNYLSNAKHSITFMCQCEEPHPSEMSWHKGKPSKLLCTRTQKCFVLPPGSMVWFKQTQSTCDNTPPIHPLTNPKPIFHTTQLGASESSTIGVPCASTMHSTSNLVSSQQVQLREVYKVMLPAASDWDNIGTLLDISEGDLKAIGRDHASGGVRTCLKQMLCAWLNQVDPSQAWRNLAEAVEPFYPNLSAKISKQYCPP